MEDDHENVYLTTEMTLWERQCPAHLSIPMDPPILLLAHLEGRNEVVPDLVQFSK